MVIYQVSGVTTMEKEVLGVSAGTHSSQVDAGHGAPFN